MMFKKRIDRDMWVILDAMVRFTTLQGLDHFKDVPETFLKSSEGLGRMSLANTIGLTLDMMSKAAMISYYKKNTWNITEKGLAFWKAMQEDEGAIPSPAPAMLKLTYHGLGRHLVTLSNGDEYGIAEQDGKLRIIGLKPELDTLITVNADPPTKNVIMVSNRERYINTIKEEK